MLLKEFVNLHQDKFKKTPVEIYNTDKEFLKDLINRYSDRVPNVFIEVETKDLHKTRFYKWWDNRRLHLKNSIKPAEHNEIIKKTKKIVKEIKIKEVKQKPIKEVNEINKNEVQKETKTEIILKQEQNINENKQTVITKQTKEYNQVYHKVVFKTELASEMYKTIDTNLKRIKIKCFEVNAMVREYKEKITNDPLRADLYLKQLQCYEKMYKIQSDAFTDNQNQLMQLRMIIENEKQIFENNLYEKTQENEAEDDNLSKHIAEIAKQIENEIKEVN